MPLYLLLNYQCSLVYIKAVLVRWSLGVWGQCISTHYITERISHCLLKKYHIIRPIHAYLTEYYSMIDNIKYKWLHIYEKYLFTRLNMHTESIVLARIFVSHGMISKRMFPHVTVFCCLCRLQYDLKCTLLPLFYSLIKFKCTITVCCDVP